MSDTASGDMTEGGGRLVAALGSTPVGKTRSGEELVQWVLGQVKARPDAEVSVTVDGSLGELRAVVAGQTGAMITALSEHMGMVDAGEGDVARVRELGQTVKPASVGLWVEARPGGIAAGWSFHGELGARTVLAAMPDNEVHKALVEVVEGLQLETMFELKASVATEQGATFCRFQVDKAAVGVVRAIAETVGVEPFADEAVALLGETVEVIVGLNDEGVCGFGVSAAAVSTATVVELVSAVGGDAPALTAFEGLLGVAERGATLWFDAVGVRALFTYRLHFDR